MTTRCRHPLSVPEHRTKHISNRFNLLLLTILKDVTRMDRKLFNNNLCYCFTELRYSTVNIRGTTTKLTLK